MTRIGLDILVSSLKIESVSRAVLGDVMIYGCTLFESSMVTSKSASGILNCTFDVHVGPTITM